MKMFVLKTFLIFLVLSVHFGLYSQTTKTVGTGGDYTTLNAAFTAVGNGSLTGVIVFEINSDITETSPTYIYESGQGSWNYTSIIVRPSGNSRTITADLAAPIFNINGNGSNITFDGRIGGTGSDSQLTISNTSGSVFYIYSVTGVDNIAIQYCNLIGNGDEIITLFTENSTITNILIDNCSIGSESLTVTNGIRSYSTGSGSITATVSNCNIFNFWNASSSSKGIFLNSGNEGWTISNNNFYQTESRTATAANTHYLIYVDGGDGHTISDNYFGGSEPQCGGTAWTINGDFANKFVGIFLNVGSTTPANVNGNVIRNFNHTYHSTTSATDSHGIWAGIYLAGGDANIGTGTSNKIGTSTGTDNIVVNSTAAADVASFGIGINSAGSTVNVNNNQIGGITLNASSITNAHSFTAINIVSGSNFIVENNLIGSTDTNNSIFLSNESNWESENQIAKGITSTSDGNVTIRSNIISRITNNGTSKGGTFGIDCSAGSYIVQNNTIDNLFSNANNSTIMGVVIGINIYNTIGNQKITGNTITNLKTTTLWAEKWIYGIYFTNNTAEENIVSHNYINNIEFTENEGRGIGIKIENSTTTIAMNNAIRLGHNQTNNRFIVGILSGGNNKILGNSVYITGSFDAEDLDSRSFAYYKYPGSDVVKNNIFYNNMSTTGFIYEDHVCIGIWDYPNASVISDYNNLLSSGREEVVAKTTELFSMTHITTQLSLEQWQTQENQDENSLSVDPQFVGADGVTPDLHISASSPMIDMGTSVYPLVVDIDNDIRDQQPDIGCDEFYTGSILVGTGETYTTLKQAFDAINDGTITGNISINIQSSTTETATATLYQSGYNGTSSYSSVSLGTVSEDIAVSGNLAAPIVSFNGAHNVNMVDLAIENESSDGYCIQFTNSASNNRIAGCNLIGNTQLSDKGIITFDVAGSGTGNNNNIIESCTFENGASNYQYGVVSAGTESVGNNDNEIAESKIYNFWSNGNSSAGIYLDENNANWNISDNHLYQTETITATGGRNHYGIFSLSSNNISISSNNIGGTDEECGGTAWTVNGSEANTYTGIFISGENMGESTVSGNTIGNFSWTAAPEANMYEGPGIWTAIAYGGGIISITNNTIGASTGVKNIDIETAAGYHVASYGIKGGIDGANVTISGNVIGSIEVSCSSVDFSHIFVGIQNDGATEIYITNNFIGSEETSTSISATTACTHTAIGQHVAGIVNNANTTVSQISSNVIKNLHNSSVSDWSSDSGSPFGHTILGIAVTDGINSISLNTIKRLSTSSIDARTESVRGISIVSDKAGQEINQNSISELSTTNDAGNSSLVGIWYDGPLGGTNTIGSNRIFYITSAYYESLASQIYGIYIANGSASIIKNNMISLGYSETAGHYITGIYTSKNGTFYHNSVVINGDVTGLLDENTFAFRINLATSTAVVKNNLFVNTRTNNGSGKNYAALCQGTIELDYNAYWVDGAGTALGNDGTDDKTELPIVSGQDQNSINQEVIFTHPTGIIVADLHTSSAVVNGVADPSVGITTDFDGETRNLSYPDIGADEFTLPVVFDPGANLDFGWTDVLTPTTAQLYDITAIDLTANLVITAPANFQVSLESESNFSQSVSISPVNTNVEETIYARYLPDVEGFVFGNISNASSGEEATVHVQGSARVILPVMETGSTADLTAETVSCIAQVTHTGGRSVIDRGVIFWAYDGVDKEIGDVGVTNENETGSFEAGEYSMAIESLGINTHYNYRAHGNNGEWDFGGIGYGLTDDFWTLANVPNAPTVSNITGDTVNISVNENLNPAYTEFAIYETTTNRFIQTDGSMNTSPVWQTKADWGTTIVTLFDAQLRTGNRSYNFETIARNGAEEQTSSSEATSILTLANTPNPMWVANPTQTTMDVATYTYMTDYSENSTGTLYAIKEANTEKFVQNDGTLAPDTVWNTRDDWGSKTVTGLSIATQCSFSSIATNDDGIRTEPGPATSLYTLAAVPGKLSFTNITSSTTDIEINASTNPENVEFAVSLSNGQYVQTDGTIASGAAWHTKTLWDNTTVTGLAPNTTYTFLVKARNGDYVETTTSEAESIVTLAATPGQPDLYNYNTFTDKLEFYPSYDTNPQNTEFAVQDSISGLYLQSDAYLGESQIWHAQAPASYIFGLNPGTKYAIRLKARNASDIETEWGVSRKLSTMPNVPGTPILSDTTTNSISVEIDNSSNPSNVNYAIYENNSSLFVKADGTFSDTEIWQTQAEWGTTSISNLNVNQNLSLKVKAKNDDNAETNYSSAISVYTLAKIPAAPTVEALSSSSISIAINTNENPGSVFFAIQEVTSGKYIGFYSGLQDVEDWRTYEYWQDCIVSGLEGSTEYSFRVKARNSDYVETDFGPEASATTLLALPPAPTLSSPANNANDQQIPVTFSWQVVDGATSYDIEYSIYPDFSIENHSVNGITELYYEASDLDHSYTYYWHVRANNEAGTGPWSDRWIFTTISGPPEAPTLQSPANESIDQPTSLSLIWNQVNNATDYYIQVALDNEFTNLVADETYGYYNYTLNNLENGTTYYWRAKAGNSYGYSNWSEEWWFTTIEGTDTPSALNSKVGLYPNPAKKVVHLTGVSGANISVRVISELGITVLQEKLLNGNLNIQSLQAGIYLLRVESSEGITIIRFIKE